MALVESLDFSPTSMNLRGDPWEQTQLQLQNIERRLQWFAFAACAVKWC